MNVALLLHLLGEDFSYKEVLRTTYFPMSKILEINYTHTLKSADKLLYLFAIVYLFQNIQS